MVRLNVAKDDKLTVGGNEGYDNPRSDNTAQFDCRYHHRDFVR